MSPLISEDKESPPILIVDRVGIFGEALVKKLSHDSATVLATNKEISSLENTVHIPFEEEIPRIPDNTYSHIFVIDDGRKITIEFLSSFLDKAKNDKAVFCFCTTLDRRENVPKELYEYRKSKIVFLGDVFPAKEQFTKSYINRFINSSKNRGKINVPQEGMAITYPVFFEDAILGILEASFGTSPEKTYFIFPKHGVTLLSLAHMIQKNDPNIKIDFSEEEPPEISIPKEGRYILPENYPLEDRINNLKVGAGRLERELKENITEQNEPNPKTSSFINLRIFSFAIIFFLFLPLFTTLLFSFIAFLTFDAGATMSSNSKYFLSISNSFFNLADNFSKPLIYETGVFGINPLSKLMQSIDLGKSQVLELSDYRNSFDLFSHGETLQAITSLKNFLIFSQENKNLKILTPDQLNFISQTINVWPQIFAIDSKKTYLILVQNNLIPRPTGGAIEAFGFLTFDNGKFSDFKVFTTQDSDKNLKGHVEPPFGLRRYLPTKNLLMNDSNFNPDFEESATSAAFFANLEEGQNTDGVIAIDLYTVQKLERLLGERGAGTFFDDVKTQANNSTFLRDTIFGIFKDFKKENNASDVFLYGDLIKLVEGKHILFYFNDSSIEDVFSTNGFSSTLVDDRANNKKTINDFVSLSEADLDGLVDNVQRSLIMTTAISPSGEVSSDAFATYKNLGETTYKNYLRFILPGGTTITKIKIDGKDTDFTDAITDPAIYEAKDFIPPQKLEIENLAESGKNLFGLFVTIPNGSTKKIEIVYKFNTLPSLSSLSDFSYNLKFFKQPGVDPYPFNFSITYPDSFKTSSNISFSTKTEKDFDLNFNFFQK